MRVIADSMYNKQQQTHLWTCYCLLYSTEILESFFSGENCVWSLYFLIITESFSFDISGKTTSGMTSACLVIWEKDVGTQLNPISEFTFSDEKCSSTASILRFTSCINKFRLLDTFSFFFLRILYLSGQFLALLTVESSSSFHLISEFLAISC